MFSCSKPNILLRQVWRSFTKSSRLLAETKHAGVQPGKVITSVDSTTKDILMYKFESPRFFKYLNMFAITQYALWIIISLSARGMVDIPVEIKKTSKEDEGPTPVGSENSEIETLKKEEDLPFWRTMNLGSDKYKYGLAVGSALMGFGIFAGSWTYILRSVRYLVFRKDGKTVSFVTYAPFGQNRILDVPLKFISAAGSRNSGASQMPVKVKGRSLYYLIDLKEGQFIHPQLFDRTVGTKRKFH